MDCFFAAVEALDDPGLAGKPIAVGGDPGRRGVIATCSYEAREFGIHSAMASARAIKLCPDLQILPPRFERYKQLSRQIREIYSQYTPIIEPLSLDEAYLDVSGCDQYQGSATRIAEAIRGQIDNELGLTASAGIAPNKMLAKVASDWNKPNGQFVITPPEVEAFVWQLPVTKLFGVGKVTAQKLHNQQVKSCGDLQGWSEQQLQGQFGSFGARLYQLCRGLDDRPLQTQRQRKSLSVERTFLADKVGFEQCGAEIDGLLATFEQRFDASGLSGKVPITTLVMKIKFADFTQTTVQQHGNKPSLDVYLSLLREGLGRNSQAVRLLGIGVRFGTEPLDDGLQLGLDID
ncbi:MAG: DNA polymerase IV [Immundisolibacteraceae bacterium]|nr:DNA polymerase IV [Immundisolibacteraceae bacterium]